MYHTWIKKKKKHLTKYVFFTCQKSIISLKIICSPNDAESQSICFVTQQIEIC